MLMHTNENNEYSLGDRFEVVIVDNENFKVTAEYEVVYIQDELNYDCILFNTHVQLK